MMGIEVLLLIPFTLNYKLFNKEQRIIYLYAIHSAALSIGAEVLARIFRHNLAWHAVMFLVAFYLLSWFFITVIKKPLTRKIIAWMVPVVTLAFIIDFFWISGPRGFSSIFVSFRTFVLIVYGILFFIQLVRDNSLIERSIYITSIPEFWFNSGVFVYQCCNFILYLSFNFLLRDEPGPEIINLFRITQGLGWIAGIIQVIVFYIGLQKIKRARS
ncbi:hypothetical protein [Chitinophaga sp.]|mgnify:CR=1 FL=1|uniref:hypothetical protein n=1 Tax=Chitinophaga sp. TaxID=1869181 RepID=UPI0026375309|nr:hypothetical protein [uncultured Chitinophaga sp.]